MGKSKAIGTRHETNAVRFMEGYGIKANRKALTGAKDEGDIDVCCSLGNVIFEVKSGKQTSNPNRSLLEEWMRQTKEESQNAGCPGFLLVIRYNRSIKDADVWWMGEPLSMHHMYFDDWCRRFS